MRRFIKWSVSVILVVVAVLTVIYLPEYMATQKDKEYVNQYQLYAQETSDTVYVDLELSEKIELLLASQSMEGNSVSVMQTTEPEVVLESNEKVFDELEMEIKQLEAMYLIPIISTSLDMKKDLEDAELYALTGSKHPGSVLYVWRLYFAKDDGSAYSVTIDAETYKIYDFYVNGEVALSYSEIYNQRIYSVGGEFYELYWNWFVEYGNYLNQVDETNVQDSETEVKELKWGDTEASGWMETEDIPWNLHLYVDFEDQMFQFQIFNVNEFDSAMESYAY